MVAPQPAVIRHSDASQLGMLAFLAGQARRRSTPQFVQQPSPQGQVFDQATAAPQQSRAPSARVVYGGQPGLEQAVESGRVVVNPQARRAELEALKERQAQRQAQTPTDSRARTRQSPLVQDLQGRDRTEQGSGVVSTRDPITGQTTAVTTMDGGVATRHDDPNAAAAARGLSELRSPDSGGFTQGTPEDRGLSTRAQTKLAYAQLSGLDQLPEQSQRALQQIIMDDDVDPQQARLMMDRIAERMGGAGDATGLSPRQAAQMQVHELRREEERAREQAEEVGQLFNPEQRRMTVEDYEQQVMDEAREASVNQFAWWGDGEITEQAAEQARQKIETFQQYKDLENKVSTLQQERRKRIGLEGGEDTGGAGGGQQGNQPARPTTQAEFDALPSGVVFIDPDSGETLRKP